MKNITQIKLNEIEKNIYCLHIIKLQYLKNNIWFNIQYNKYENFFEFSKYEYFQSLKEYKKDYNNDVLDIKFITDKNYSYDIISVLIKFITHYIIENKPELFSNFITILKNNITSTKNNEIYFKKGLFKDIKKLNFEIKICFKVLKSNPKIIDIINDNNQIKFILDNEIIIKLNDYYDYNNINNSLNYIIVKDNNIIKEFEDIYYNTLIINFNNNIINEFDDNIFIDENKTLKDENKALKEENKKLKEDLKMLKMILTNPEEFFEIKH